MKSIFSHYRVAACVVVLMVISLRPVYAGPLAGDSEIQVSAGFFHAQSSDTGNFNVDMSYGYYLSPGWEVGLRQALNYNFVDRGSDSWQATTTPFILYNFRVTEVLVPYLGISGGLVGTTETSQGRWDPMQG
jgi:hypothetical protein